MQAQSWWVYDGVQRDSLTHAKKKEKIKSCVYSFFFNRKSVFFLQVYMTHFSIEISFFHPSKRPQKKKANWDELKGILSKPKTTRQRCRCFSPRRTAHDFAEKIAAPGSRRGQEPGSDQGVNNLSSLPSKSPFGFLNCFSFKSPFCQMNLHKRSRGRKKNKLP